MTTMDPTRVKFPTCARCQKPVERLVTLEEPFLEKLRVRVYCHGEHEEVEIDLRELGSPDSGLNFGGVAFATPRELTP